MHRNASTFPKNHPIKAFFNRFLGNDGSGARSLLSPRHHTCSPAFFACPTACQKAGNLHPSTHKCVAAVSSNIGLSPPFILIFIFIGFLRSQPGILRNLDRYPSSIGRSQANDRSNSGSLVSFTPCGQRNSTSSGTPPSANFCQSGIWY